MTEHKFYAPRTLDELLQILAENQGQTQILAGGTDVVVAMREGKINRECIVALYKVPELKGIRRTGDTLVVGAMTTFTEVVKSPLIQAGAALLAEAAASVGSPQIRNAGTIGGNIVNASPAADTVPAMMALNAVVRILSRGGERTMKLEEFFAGMGKTKLEEGEMIADISLPVLPEHTGGAFIKLARRNALAISRISAAAIVGCDPVSNMVTDCRIAMGAVAANPFRLHSAEAAWIGQSADDAQLEACVQAAAQALSDSLGKRASAVYKTKAGPALVRRALSQALEQARGAAGETGAAG